MFLFSIVLSLPLVRYKQTIYDDAWYFIALKVYAIQTAYVHALPCFPVYQKRIAIRRLNIFLQSCYHDTF